MTEVVLGRKYRDTVTGLVGIATSKNEDLNGMIQYVIDPGVDKDGKMQESFQFDPATLVDVETKEKAKPARRGGPTQKVAR